MIRFDDLVKCLLDQQAIVRSQEARIRRLEQERDDWREMAEPGFRQRELRECIDGEIRLLREQG